MDKILRIDMGAEGGPKVRTEPLGGYAGLGGRSHDIGHRRQRGAAALPPLGRRQQAGHRTGTAQRNHGRHVGTASRWDARAP